MTVYGLGLVGWMLPSGLSKRQLKRARDQLRWRQASDGGVDGGDSIGSPQEYGHGRSGPSRRKGGHWTLVRWIWVRWRRSGGQNVEGRKRAIRHWLARQLRAWFVYVRSGGFAKAEIIDDEEGLFRTMDPTLVERKRERESLREFLLRGQKEWSKDGGVVVKPKREDPRLTELWPFIWKARRRRPTRVISVDENVAEFVGTFWAMEDFVGVEPEVRKVLEETRRRRQSK